MLIDTNILLYSVDMDSRFHPFVRPWLEGALNGSRMLGLPWQSLTGFLRLATNSRVMNNPLSPSVAWAIVDEWLESPSTWIPQPTPRHAEILGGLVRNLQLSGNLIPDATLAALCIEHGLAIVSADSDFARFAELTWINPLV